jgi:branched-chain amino acid transport system permease protein
MPRTGIFSSGVSLLVVFIVALPEGVFHYIERKYHQVERWVEVER